MWMNFFFPREKALRLWNEKRDYSFAKDTLFYTKQGKNLWMLSSFCLHNRNWMDKKGESEGKHFFWGGAGGESVDGTHVRLVTGVMQIFTSWYPHGPFSAIWDKGHNLACMKCTFISNFIRKWIFSFLFKLPEYRMKINCVPGLMTHIHLHLSSSMSIFKRN